MPGHGAEVGELTLLLEADDEPRRLARANQRRPLAVDLEIVLGVAGVPEDERHLARPPDRLRPELEAELLTRDRDRTCGRVRLGRARRLGRERVCDQLVLRLLVEPGRAGADEQRVAVYCRERVDAGWGLDGPQCLARLRVEGVDRAVVGAGEDNVVRDGGRAEVR